MLRALSAGAPRTRGRRGATRRLPAPPTALAPPLALSAATRAALGALAGRARTALAAAPPRAGAGSSGPAFETGGVDDLRFLVTRATNGFSLPAWQEALALGYDAWLAQQLDWESVDDSELDAALATLPTLGMSAEELLVGYPDEMATQVVLELQVAQVLRAVYSRRQLYERMVELWTDHFNISQLDDLCLWLKTVDDREVVRRHALGRFPEMLAASARSAAMLWYLDNYANVAGAAQENWARELLELHTLGVDGPYTEQDVREVARCFTGWTFHGVYTDGPLGEFVFVPALHDDGEKIVLGETIPAGGGVTDGERVLRILGRHPATARFVARKLCRWLLAYEPPVELVDRIAGVYETTGGDLREMARGVLHPASVASVPAEDRVQLRRPWTWVTGLLRAGVVTTSDPLQITFEMTRFGQVPYFWPAPNGYPHSLGAWGGGVLPRWSFASRLFRGEIPGNVPAHSTLLLLLQGAPRAEVAAAIDHALTGGAMDPADVAGVQAFVDAQPALDEAVLREAFALAASAPSTQLF